MLPTYPNQSVTFILQTMRENISVDDNKNQMSMNVRTHVAQNPQPTSVYYSAWTPIMHALTKDSWRYKSFTGKLTPETFKTAGNGGVALCNVLCIHVTLWTDLL